MYPKTTMYRVRIGWLDWANELRWSDWFDIAGLKGEYLLNGVPPRVAAVSQDGFVLDSKMKTPNISNHGMAPSHTAGRYIPAHRITAIDWEEV